MLKVSNTLNLEQLRTFSPLSQSSDSRETFSYYEEHYQRESGILSRSDSFEIEEDLSQPPSPHIRCPRPVRPPKSPVLSRTVRLSKRKQRENAKPRQQLEASEEIQNILSSSCSVNVRADDVEIKVPPRAVTPGRSSSPRFDDFHFDVTSISPDPTIDYRESLKDSTGGLRLVFSHSPVLRRNDSARSLTESIPTVPTPPIRVHNPLPRNSPFSHHFDNREGAEIGLLSISPPPSTLQTLRAKRDRIRKKN